MGLTYLVTDGAGFIGAHVVWTPDTSKIRSVNGGQPTRSRGKLLEETITPQRDEVRRKA